MSDPVPPLDEQHGHPGEVCRVGEYDGKATTCVQSWERWGREREQPPLISADEVERIFDAWCEELVRHYGDRTVAAVLSSPAIQAAFTGDIGQSATARRQS